LTSRRRSPTRRTARFSTTSSMRNQVRFTLYGSSGAFRAPSATPPPTRPTAVFPFTSHGDGVLRLGDATQARATTRTHRSRACRPDTCRCAHIWPCP
jgi:hypothetical protein